MRNPTRMAVLLLAAFSASCMRDTPTDPRTTAADVMSAGMSVVFPDVIPLPDEWQPEGIVSGRGSRFYAGSLAGAGLYAGDFRTGEGEVLAASAGQVIVGLDYDVRSDHVFAAGGPTGEGRVYDGTTGALLATYPLAAPGGSFVNDVIVTRDAAYFTDSFNAVLYVIPLGPGGHLPDPTAAEAIALSGVWVQVGGFNANGIDATANGNTLIVVNSTLGNLHTVDPQSGEATQIDLGGDGAVLAGDGILLDGRTLYVVQNALNRIAVVELDARLETGSVTRTITDPAFDVPTTVAEHGARLYAVNARFGTPPAGASYSIVGVSKR
jgi:hypothetical protein